MKAIVAVDEKWGIGYNGQLLYHSSKDMNFFKNYTIGKIVVMGRKTFETLPNKKPLKDRINIILTNNYNYYKDFQSYHSQDEYKNCYILYQSKNLKNEIEKELGYKIDTNDIIIIGGASVYQQFYQDCSEISVTYFKIDSINVDAFFPNLDNDNNWKCVSIEHFFDKIKDDGSINMGRFKTYIKN